MQRLKFLHSIANDSKTLYVAKGVEDMILMGELESRSVLETTCRLLGISSKTVSNQSLTQLMQLFVHRNHLLWKDKAALNWLMDCALKVVGRVDAGDPLAAENKTKRELRYVGTPRNVLRHILLSDIKEVPVVLPENVQGGVLSFDPLPPLDSKDLYSRVERPRPQVGGSGANTTNILATFFRSLIPTFPMEQQGRHEYDIVIQPDHGVEMEEEAGGVVAGAAALELRQSVTSLVDAMRDLLSNIHLPQTTPSTNLPASSDYDDSDSDTDSAADGFSYFPTFGDEDSGPDDEQQ